MTRNFTFVLLFFFGLNAVAQDNCSEQVEELRVLTNNHQFHEASTLVASNECLIKHPDAFTDVEKILIYRVESAATDDDKKKQLDNLLDLYDEYDLANPGNSKGNKLKKVVALKRFSSGSESDIFKILDAEFKRDLKNFNDASAIALYFDLYYAKFSAGEKGYSENDVFEKHDILLQKLDQLATSDPDNAREYLTAASGISALVNPIATCEKLEAYYKKGLASHKTDATWLAQAAMGMRAQNCESSQVFAELSTQWFAVQKSAASAYNMAIAQRGTQKMGEDIKYYEVAADLETDNAAKSSIYQKIAMSLVGSDNSKSLDFTRKAIAANPNNGKAYLLLAQLYSSAQDCGNTLVEKKAIYILAAKTALLAAEKDPSLKATATRQAELFNKKAPSPEEIKNEKKSGKTVNFDCWIKTSVTLP